MIPQRYPSYRRFNAKLEGLTALSFSSGSASAKTHYKWMMAALESAKLALPIDVPVGAIILHNGQIVASAYNQRELNQDPLGHAELLALRQAAHHLGNWRLDECTLYVTLEPCPMCASAIAQARVSTVVFGAYDPLAGACGSKHALLMPGENQSKPQVWGGILEEPCKALLQEFFNARRAGAEAV